MYGAYALLEKLGFIFLQPFAPTAGSIHDYDFDFQVEDSKSVFRYNVKRKPKWPIRQWHYHTMHPIELVNVFNGWGVNGIQDTHGFHRYVHLFVLPTFTAWKYRNESRLISHNDYKLQHNSLYAN
mmetsp:Transcript_20515/g.24932  ORF Transcript_20515/g.24932 Transcript_20515/m.24932 type:complete len:125 (+) Transcript_20515:128-502(+)